MAAKKLINSPVLYYSRSLFTGDNVAHYLPAKYLWHVCNVTKTGFHQPVYDFRLSEPVTIDFLFYPQQPQNLYFKKPTWINQFVVAKNTRSANKLAGEYDYFINNYRYRGANPPQNNWGYSTDLKEINLYIPAYTYKAVYDHGLYIDDLQLADDFREFLNNVRKEINPEGRPVIAIHHRGNDPWKRHLPENEKNNEELLFSLLSGYPDSLVVIAGEPWRYYDHPRVRYLTMYLNRKKLTKAIGHYSACLQFILAAFFCREVERIFIGISGFTLFLESIRPIGLMPPIPIYWAEKIFTGIDTCIEAMKKWRCPEFESYKKAHPEDKAFQHYVHHFMYYARDDELLRPYCFDYPNDTGKIFSLLSRLENKYCKGEKEQRRHEATAIQIEHAPPRSAKEIVANLMWKFSNRATCEKLRWLWLFRGVVKVIGLKLEALREKRKYLRQ